jgi:hypothetical protein
LHSHSILGVSERMHWPPVWNSHFPPSRMFRKLTKNVSSTKLLLWCSCCWYRDAVIIDIGVVILGSFLYVSFKLCIEGLNTLLFDRLFTTPVLISTHNPTTSSYHHTTFPPQSHLRDNTDPAPVFTINSSCKIIYFLLTFSVNGFTFIHSIRRRADWPCTNMSIKRMGCGDCSAVMMYGALWQSITWTKKRKYVIVKLLLWLTSLNEFHFPLSSK